MSKLSPKIILPMNLRNKIQFIVDNCALEVSGLGTVKFDKEQNAYRVTDIILLDQEVGSAHTDLDDTAVAKACYDMKDADGELAFWWHSHVNMGVFWSATDHDTIEQIGKNGLCVAIVFNKKEEMKGAIMITPDGMPSIKLDDVPIEIEYEYDFNPDTLLAEMKEKVREKKYIPQGNYGKQWQENLALNNTQTSTAKTRPKNVGEVRALQKDVEFKQDCLAKWNALPWAEKQRHDSFDDFVEECAWDMYAFDDSYQLGFDA